MKNKTFLIFSTLLILSLLDPFSFEIPINLGFGPNFYAFELLFLIYFALCFNSISRLLNNSKVLIFFFVWIFWGIFSVLHGAMNYKLTVAITESNTYIIMPIFMLISYWLLAYKTNYNEFFDKFIKKAILFIILLFLVSLAFYIINNKYVFMSLVEYLDPSMYATIGVNPYSDWARFMNSYSASFLAIIIPIYLISKYRFKNNQKINIFIIILGFIALSLGQVRTVWGILAVNLILALSFVIVFNKNKKHSFKFFTYLIVFVLFAIGVLVYFNDIGLINLQRSLTPFEQGFNQTGTFQWREIVWAQILSKWKLSPILGLGYGGYYKGPIGEEVTTPHSSYIAVLTKQGIIGASLMGLMFLAFLIYFIKNYFKSGEDIIKYGSLWGIIVIISMLVFAYSYEFTIIQWVLLGVAFYLVNYKKFNQQLV